jgi:hypothetical protein
VAQKDRVSLSGFLGVSRTQLCMAMQSSVLASRAPLTSSAIEFRSEGICTCHNKTLIRPFKIARHKELKVLHLIGIQPVNELQHGQVCLQADGTCSLAHARWHMLAGTCSLAGNIKEGTGTVISVSLTQTCMWGCW